MSVEDIFAGCDGDPMLMRALVVSCIEDEPHRVTYDDLDCDQYRDVFKVIYIDGVEIPYVRCVHEACCEMIILLRNNNRKSFTFPRHCKDQHLPTGYGAFGLRKRCKARPEDEINRFLEKASKNGEGKHPKTQTIWKNFVNNGKMSKKGREIWDCCWCEFSCAKSSAAFKEHQLSDCTNFPSEIKEEIIRVGPCKRKKENPILDKPRKSLLYRQLGIQPRKIIAPEPVFSQQDDVVTFDDNQIFDEPMDSSDDSIDLRMDNGALNNEAMRMKAVEILTRLLPDHDGQKQDKEKGKSESPGEVERMAKMSNEELDREIRYFKLQKLKKQLGSDKSSREAQLERREEQLQLKMRQIDAKERVQRDKLLNDLEAMAGDTIRQLVQNVFEAVMSD